MQRLTLSKDLSAALRLGHPWIYGRALRSLPRGLAPGELVAVEHHGGVVAVGYADPGSPIAVRVLGRAGDREELAASGGAWVTARVARACAARAAQPGLAATDAMRLVHGENDYLPGLVIDRYADVAVVVYDGDGARALWQSHRSAIAAGLPPGLRLVERAEAPAGDVEIHEGRARFLVDLRLGQKTGFFLDQRDNRARVADMARGLELLNLFCYTGGFSVHAGLAGARTVSVDQAAPAMAAARRNLAINGLADAGHELVTKDAFVFLERARGQGRTWDIVVCDPPSFAPSERLRPRALGAYRRLNALAMSAVSPGGTLVTASCSSHVSADDLRDVVADAAAGERRVPRVLGTYGAAGDHPTRPGFREGVYLCCLFVALD